MHNLACFFGWHFPGLRQQDYNQLIIKIGLSGRQEDAAAIATARVPIATPGLRHVYKWWLIAPAAARNGIPLDRSGRDAAPSHGNARVNARWLLRLTDSPFHAPSLAPTVA